MSCNFCGESNHNIRYCTHRGIEFALLKLRCKVWESLNKNNTLILYKWLTKNTVSTLRIICIHKYNTFPKTRSVTKLAAIVMHLEFHRIIEEEDAFWMIHLPDGFSVGAFDCNNVRERGILIMNINVYSATIDPTLIFKSNEDLGDILMRLISEYKKTHRSSDRHVPIRTRIDYIELQDIGESTNECAICYDEMGTNIARLGCNHEFCCGCIERHVRCTKTPIVNCPMCRGEVMSISALRDGNDALVSIL